MERLGAACRALRHDKGRYEYVARAQWGEAFWERAATRAASRAFEPMRRELRYISSCTACATSWGCRSDARALTPWEAEERHLMNRRRERPRSA